MIEVTEDMLEKAYELIANGDPEAVGYRVMIYPLEATDKLEKAEMEMFPTLAQKGAVTKSNDQKERESKGTHHGLVVHVGPSAYREDNAPRGPWVEEGDVCIFDRYYGVEVELPPGSKQKFRFINSEAFLGKMRPKQ